jgi:predicted ArsR family transcriptional regulator
MEQSQIWLLRQLEESEMSLKKIAEEMKITPQSLRQRIKLLKKGNYITEEFLRERRQKYGKPGRPKTNR